MPKRTKQQKKLAAKHRTKAIYSVVERTPTAARVTKKPTISHVETGDEQTLEIATTSHVEDTRYFFQDFTRSALIIGVIIALEIIAYFGTMN